MVVERYFDFFCGNSRGEPGWAGPLGQFGVDDYDDRSKQILNGANVSLNWAIKLVRVGKSLMFMVIDRRSY